MVEHARLGSLTTVSSTITKSALPPKADIPRGKQHVRFVPIDGVIGRANLWIAEDFGCCASG